MIIRILQPYEKKPVDIMTLYSGKIYLEDITSIKCLIFYRFP